MRQIDRIIVIALVVGVWSLVTLIVINPNATNAQSNHVHNCTISGLGVGGLSGRNTYISNWEQVEVRCP